LSLSERARLVDDLGFYNAMILRNHGLLGAGKSIAWAFHEIYFLERACQAQIKALAGGAELIFLPKRCAVTRPSNSGVRELILSSITAGKPPRV
jgi:adducin